MPITKFQQKVLLLLRKHRNPNSYIAGGVAINRSTTSPRESNDIDLFHDSEEAVNAGSDADIELLRKHGYTVHTFIKQPSFIRAVISLGSESLKLEWVRDTAFRFFPVIEDEELGFRLHDVDLAVNKCLALANRSEVRDIIDLIQLNKEVLSLAAACWAACGKDPGFTPRMLLDCMQRNSIIRPEQLLAESTREKLSATELKTVWRTLLAEAEQAVTTWPSEDLGCLYLETNGSIIRSPQQHSLKEKIRHFGSSGGSWPKIV